LFLKNKLMVKEDLSKNIVIPVWGVMIMVTIFIALFGFVYRISVFQGQTFEQIRQVRADIDARTNYNPFEHHRFKEYKSRQTGG
jgi:hypothetical protein